MRVFAMVLHLSVGCGGFDDGDPDPMMPETTNPSTPPMEEKWRPPAPVVDDIAPPTSRVVEVAAGTHALRDVFTTSGTADGWVRYQPATPGTVVLKAGELPRVEYVILDGFTFDSRLHEDWPERTHGLDIESSHVRIENSLFAGPHDIHTGFAVDGSRDCSEFTGGTRSTGVSVGTMQTDVTFFNVVVHGFQNAGSFQVGSDVRVKDSLFRNGFNGLSLMGASVVITGTVFWVHPNHLFSVKSATGTVVMRDNLMVDGQDMFQAGMNWTGAAHAELTHNTFYVPDNKPCYDFTGVNFYNVQSATLRDNVFVKKDEGFLSLRQQLLPHLASDYNLVFRFESPPREDVRLVDASPAGVFFSEWRSKYGQDVHSVTGRPEFTDAPRYGDVAANKWEFRIPATREEARAWFGLKASSPGKSAAFDGTDMGIAP